MRWIIVATAVLAAKVSAADFRVADFGSPCAQIRDLEEARGSKQIILDASDSNKQAFKGSAFNRDATILYVCKDGKFAVGNYFYPQQHFDNALQNFHDIYDNLISTYGTPFYDSSPWQAGTDKDSRHIAPDPSKYVVNWQRGRLNTTINLVTNGDVIGANWEVIVVVSPRDL
ncbi:MAG: hypothetical protein ACLPV8_24410 [Steroidobacteraceae bacterium]